jgi:hypothetical protein
MCNVEGSSMVPSVTSVHVTITPSERPSSVQDSYHDAKEEHYHDDEESNRNVQSEDTNKQSGRQDTELEGGTGPYTDSEYKLQGYQQSHALPQWLEETYPLGEK